MQYQAWKRLPEDERTWANFETFWQTEYDLWQETSRTAAQVGYGGNAEENKEMVEAEQAYLRSLQHFGETNNHNAATFEMLSNTNNNLVNNMAAAIQQLNHQVNGLACAVQAAQQQRPTPGYHQPPPAAQYPPQNFQPIPPYQPPQQQYAQQQAYPYQGGPRQMPTTGRGCGRGRGNGRGNRNVGRGRGQNRGYVQPNQQAYYQQGGYQMYQPGQNQPYQQGQQNFNQFPQQQNVNPPYSNTVKFYKNWNYCHSCGYDVEDDHMSQTCPNPKPYHIWTATRDNPCGGCKKGMHKNRM